MKDSYTKDEIDEMILKVRRKKQDQFADEVFQAQHLGIKSSEEALQVYLKVKALEQDRDSYNAGLDAVSYSFFENALN